MPITIRQIVDKVSQKEKETTKDMRNKTKQIVPIVIASLAIIGLFSACASLKGLVVLPESAAKIVPSSDFQVSELLIIPAVAVPGEPIFITAKVKNTGEFDGTCEAELRIDNVREFANTVAVPAGGTQNLIFSVSRDTPATYQVALNELAGEFKVAERAVIQSNAASGGFQSANSSCCGSPGSCRCGVANSSSTSPQGVPAGDCGCGK
jgi:hypothetical protein